MQPETATVEQELQPVPEPGIATTVEAPAERPEPNDDLTTAIGICLICAELIQPDQDGCPNDDFSGPFPDHHPIRWFARPEPPVRFPVGSLREAIPFLRRPFTKEAVKWKVQAAYGTTGGLVVGHLDARLVIERLNLVIADRWRAEFDGTPDGLMVCRLTVDGVTREDVGEGKGKALRSDALKRAAVQFGIGVSVYAIPKLVLELGEGKGLKEVDQKKTRVITNAGLKLCVEHYENWLKETGVPHFGEPIDHGDVENSAGDEADTPADGEAGSDLPAVEMPLTDAKADELRRLCRATYNNVKKSSLPKARFDAELASASTSHEALEAFHARLAEMAK